MAQTKLKDITYEFDPLLMEEIHWERIKQIQQWGGAEHDDTHNVWDWFNYIHYQMELPDPQSRLIKIAALAIAALESLDRKINGH